MMTERWNGAHHRKFNCNDPENPPGRDKAKRAGTIIQVNVTSPQAGQWNAVINDGKANVAKGTLTPLQSPGRRILLIFLQPQTEAESSSSLHTGQAKVQGDLTEALVKVFMPN